MQRKIKNISCLDMLWLIVYLMPFLAFGGYCLINSHSSGVSMTNFINDLYNLTGGVGFIGEALEYLLSYFDISISNNNIYVIMIMYLEFFVMINIFRIFIDVVLMLPNIVHKWFDKIGGE